MGSARPLYPSSNDPELRNGSPRYVAAGTNSCPPPHILEKHFSSPTEESHPRFNAVRTQFTTLHVSVCSIFWLVGDIPGKRRREGRRGKGGSISCLFHNMFFKTSKNRGTNVERFWGNLCLTPHPYALVKQNPPALLRAPERQRSHGNAPSRRDCYR